MIYEIEVQFSGWAITTVTVTAEDEGEAYSAAVAIARATPENELRLVLEDPIYDIILRNEYEEEGK